MPKRIPIRMCVGCRSRQEKRQLIRVVRTPSGEVVIDPTGKLAGRGAYICPKTECFRQAVKSRALERALGQKLSPEIISALEKKIEDGEK